VKNLSRRVAALTPSITVALILFTVGLTGLLAYRAFEASRAQQQTVERTLRDYAGFAAFQLKNATYSRLASSQRITVDNVLRLSDAGPAPLGVKTIAAMMDSGRARCRCLQGISFYYQVTFAGAGVPPGARDDERGGAIETTASPLATPANVDAIRDTVIAQALAPAPEPAAPALGERRTFAPSGGTQFFIPIFSRLGGTAYVFAHILSTDGAGAPFAAYGYAMPAEVFVGDAVRLVLATQPVLPRTLTRELKPDSILTVRVTDGAGRLVYANNEEIDTRFAASDSLDQRLGGLHFQVAISPAAAGRLIIGGLPRSRLPEVLATAVVSMSLLGLLLYQFRRQEELGRLRDEFVSGVSHELRTPLAQIRLLAELLRMGKVPTQEHKDRSLRIIDQEARRLSMLVESILSFTRSHAATLSPVRTDISTEITEILEGFKPLAQAQSVHLTTHLESDLAAEVDRDALRQVLINLLDNAVRYGPSGQTVAIATASSGDVWTLEVLDEGPGIPPDERERIFAPYYRMERDAGGAVGGTGIGLSVVRRLVKQHGGTVREEGNTGRGARFVVTLPQRWRADSSAEPAVKSNATNGRRVTAP
jgi:signal transduction histidine kinase